ncbi:MAG: NAD/NADP octopine/nopaline dehydrogenase family protein [Myxococcota bacterium]
MTSLLSQVSRNDVRALLAARGLTVAEAAEQTGLTTEKLQALHDNPRLIPEPLTIYALCMALQVPIEAVVRHDPAVSSVRARLGGGDGPLQVTVCGAGNLGHVFLGRLGNHPEVRVNLLTSSEERADMLRRAMQDGVRVRSRDGEVVGRPHVVTADPARVIPGSRLVLMCLPSFCEPAVLARIVPHLDDGALVGSIPGPGGVHWAARRALEAAGKRATVFGLASIPWMCKLDEPGRSVRVLGTKTITGLATADRENAALASDLMALLVGFPVIDIGNFLQIIFNPGNQLLHPGLMFDLFANWDATPLPEPPLFYESATSEGAAVVAAMGEEILAMRAAIEAARPDFDLTAVLPVDLAIRAAYSSDIADHSSLQRILASNRAYAGIRTPMLKVDGGYVPNWGSRFFLEDIPFGLVVLRGIAELADVRTPMIDKVLTWAQERMGKRYLVDGRLSGPDVAESGAPQRHGFRTLNQLLDGEATAHAG